MGDKSTGMHKRVSVRRVTNDMTDSVSHERMQISDITPPFDFSKFVWLYGSYKYPELVDVVEDGRYYRVVYLEGGRKALLVLESAGTIEQPVLSVDVYSEDALSTDDLSFIRSKIRWMLGLDEDLTGFYDYVSSRDPVLSRLVERFRGLRAPATPTVFEAVVHALVEQQISFNFAGKIKSRLVEAYGEIFELDGHRFHAFPRPERLAGATPEELRRLQLSRRKGEYIIGVASKVVAGEFDFEKLVSLPNELVIEKITELRGLGKWTAEMIMVRGMRKLDAIPADDIALRRLISHYYFGDAKVSAGQARSLAEERWGKYRGYAAFYLMYGGRRDGFLK